MQLKQIYLFELMEKAKKNVAYNFKKSKVSLIIEKPKENKIISIFSQYLLMALQNILLNAAKHSYENEWVLFKSNITEHEIFFTILDYGSGISKKALPHIFEPFFKKKI